MAPKHDNPRTSRRTPTRERREAFVGAVAPYNFVPLPNRAVDEAEAEIPTRDRFVGRSGYVECKLTTCTPLYTRTGLTPESFKKWGDRIRDMMKDAGARDDYAQFFHLTDTNHPVVPGSSLRGMARALLEIVSYSHMPWVTDKQLFFRTMDDTAVGDHYRGRMMVDGGPRVRAGMLKWDGKEHTYYIEERRLARVSRSQLASQREFDLSDLYEDRGPMARPRWETKDPSKPYFQYARVWVLVDRGRVDKISRTTFAGAQPGTLVITGNMQKKLAEFVFLDTPIGSHIPVPDARVRQFADEDQVTLWQERAFPKDQPQPANAAGRAPTNVRERPGLLRNTALLESAGDPVFFLIEHDPDGQETIYFGRSRMFRLPYQHSPRDFVPADVRESTAGRVDLADAIFGYVADSRRDTSRAGRVFFTDAVLDGEQPNLRLSSQPITPKILGSPKPTTFQHYLVQNRDAGHDPDNQRALAHYGDPTPAETVIRGHKLYWHKHDEASVTPATFGEANAVNWNSDTQHTQICPVRAGVTFKFRVYFENLRDHELGALLWVLALPGDGESSPYRHKLGMGKPLGLGTVQVEPKLVLIDRTARYKQLFAGNGWATAAAEEAPAALQAFMKGFETALLDQLYNGAASRPTQLAQMARIKMLLELLKWPGPGDKLTRYMEIQHVDPEHRDLGQYNEYAKRPVLPDPLHVADPLQEPGPEPRGHHADRYARPAQDRDSRPQNVQAGPHPAPKPAYSDPPAAPAAGAQARKIEEEIKARILGGAAPSTPDAPPPTPTGAQPVAEPMTVEEAKPRLRVRATVKSTTADAVLVTVGPAELPGTLALDQISPAIKPGALAEKYPPGAGFEAWVKSVNSKGRIQLTLRAPRTS